MPTGAGKTRTAMHLVARHLRENEPTVVVWLALSGELLEQAATEFERAWSFLGNRPLSVVRFWGSRQCDLLSFRDGLVVGGLGKLHAASLVDGNLVPSFADAVSLTVMDEAHQAIAPTYTNLLNILSAKCPSAALLGLTATPGRTYSDIAKDEVLSEFFGRNKVTLEIPGYDSPIRYLIDEGYLARPVFRRLDIESAVHLTAKTRAELEESLDLPDGLLDQLAEDDRRNLLIVRETEALLGRHRRVIVFATTKNHAVVLAAVMRARGYVAESVTGETSEFERQAILQRYVSNDSTPIALFNYGVLTTGFDAPATSAALIARPTRSLVLFSQMVGRAIRGPKSGNGNESAEIVSVVDLSLPGFDDPANAFTNWEDVWR
jgi:superfamily II DNA or RNA helicase